MGIAAFSCNVTYSPGGGGTLSQSFNVAAPYTGISAGKIDVAAGSAANGDYDISFGSVGVDARGVLIQNNTDSDVEIDVNAAGTSTPQYALAPGGVFMHWAPKKATAKSLVSLGLTIAAAISTSKGGAIDFIVLGD